MLESPEIKFQANPSRTTEKWQFEVATRNETRNPIWQPHMQTRVTKSSTYVKFVITFEDAANPTII